MHKQKNKSETSTEKLQQLATHVGAWVLTVTALMAASEKLHHIELAHVTVQAGHSTSAPAHQPEAIRAEGAKETARLPEEYDVGLRMPGISGI